MKSVSAFVFRKNEKYNFSKKNCLHENIAQGLSNNDVLKTKFHECVPINKSMFSYQQHK